MILTLGFSLTMGEAEAAKRIGAGKSFGMQRQMSTPAKAPAAAPAAAPQVQPKRSWMGPIAGLAAGLGLAALASHFGFGEELASMLMIGLLVMAVMIAVGLFMRRRAAAHQPAMAGINRMQYAASDINTAIPGPRSGDLPNSSARQVEAVTHNSTIPADFDVAGFVRSAKLNFIQLQAANDAGNLDDIRKVTTPEMFAELQMNISDRGNGIQVTEVVNVDADIIEVHEEKARYVVSVRFSGMMREETHGPVESIDEIWHLVKPRDGTGGWLLAGIQQIQ